MASIELDIDIKDHLHEVNAKHLIKELLSRDEDGLKLALQLLNIDSFKHATMLEDFLYVFKNIPENELREFLEKYI